MGCGDADLNNTPNAGKEVVSCLSAGGGDEVSAALATRSHT